MKIFSYLLVTCLTIGCTTTTTQRVELNVGGQQVQYTIHSCAPSIKWDGFELILDGIQVPNQNNLAFSIGKINYSQKALREIHSTVFYYDGLLKATCQTLVRLNNQDAIERYSKHRDALLSELINTLVALEQAPTENVATNIAMQAKNDAQQQSKALYSK